MTLLTDYDKNQSRALEGFGFGYLIGFKEFSREGI